MKLTNLILIMLACGCAYGAANDIDPAELLEGLRRFASAAGWV